MTTARMRRVCETGDGGRRGIARVAVGRERGRGPRREGPTLPAAGVLPPGRRSARTWRTVYWFSTFALTTRSCSVLSGSDVTSKRNKSSNLFGVLWRLDISKSRNRRLCGFDSHLRHSVVASEVPRTRRLAPGQLRRNGVGAPFTASGALFTLKPAGASWCCASRETRGARTTATRARCPGRPPVRARPELPATVILLQSARSNRSVA